jgi:hypothetical protein
MDWKYKHFRQEAILKASRESVLEATRSVMAESLGGILDTPDGLVARGHSAWHTAVATFIITPIPDGTRVVVELLVERAAARGYMLFDVGGYYNGQIDKWFSGILQHLGGAQEQTLVSKSTSNLRVWRGCLAGCLVYLVTGTCLGILAIPFSRVQFPQFSGPFEGPFGILASTLGLFAGVAAFLYVLYPDASASKFVRERLHRTRDKKKSNGDNLPSRSGT